MTGDSVERLVYMANQIARNLEHEPHPVEATADHINMFWSPRMKDQIFAHGPEGLDPVALSAIGRLRHGATPDHMSRATDPAVHGSDAG